MAEARATIQPRSVPVRAVLYMIAAVSTLAILDAGVKWLTAAYPVPQIAFLRYLVGLAIAVPLAARLGGIATLRTQRLPGHVQRSVLNLATILTFYFALKLMPLADAIAITFAAPLFMTVLSVPLLRERVGPRRWTALVTGFAGVVVILRPSGGGLDPAALMALASAFLYALTMITSRRLSTTESSHTILFYYSAAGLIATGAVLPWQWVTPALADLWVFLLVGLAGGFGQFFLNQAFRYGEVSLLAPIEYTALLWAVLLGFLLWGDVPGWSVLGGAALVIGSSLYIVHRETVLARRSQRRRSADRPVPPQP